MDKHTILKALVLTGEICEQIDGPLDRQRTRVRRSSRQDWGFTGKKQKVPDEWLQQEVEEPLGRALPALRLLTTYAGFTKPFASPCDGGQDHRSRLDH